MSLFRISLSGYDRKEVEREFKALRDKLGSLETKEKEYKAIIHELKQSLKNYQDRENFIGEVMLDAKQISQDLLKSSQENAEKESKQLLSDAQKRLEEAEAELSAYKHLEEGLSAYENNLKNRLRTVFDGYLKEVEQIDLKSEVASLRDLSQVAEEVKEQVRQQKSLITLPKEAPKDNIPVYVVK